MAKEKTPTKRSLLSQSDKRTLMAILIRNPAAFDAVSGVLKAENFPPHDFAYAAVWKIVCDFHAEHGTLPDQTLLVAEVQHALDHSTEDLTQTDQDDLEDLLQYAYSKKAWPEDNPITSETRTRWAIKRATKLCEEHVILKASESLIKGQRISLNLPDLLQRTSEAVAQANSLGVNGDTSTFTPNWDKQGGLKVTKTGLSFLDALMGQGDAPGEVYLLIGPTGSCKTTIGLQRLVTGAQQAAEETARTGVMHYAAFVTYEQPLQPDLRLRLLSCAGQIRVSSLRKMDERGLACLSTTKNPRNYEKKLWERQKKEGVPPQGEQERAAKAIALLSKHTIVIDFSGQDPNRRGAGSGYVQEIARALSTELRRRGGGNVLVTVIDYAGLCAERYIEAQNLDKDRFMRITLKRMPSLLRELVTMPFKGNRVYLLHQSSTEANARPPGSPPHHTDAADCKSMGDNCEFAMALGTLTKDNMCQLAASKVRRTERRDPAVLFVDGKMNVVHNYSRHYTVDTVNRTIRSVEEVNTVSSKKTRVASMAPGGNRLDTIPGDDEKVPVLKMAEDDE